MFIVLATWIEMTLDHIEMDTEVIKLIHIVKELFEYQDDHENHDHLDMKLILDWSASPRDRT